MNGDELAGVVDLFGALTRRELHDALEELAFKRGDDFDADEADDDVMDALREYYLVSVDRENGDSVLVPGPAAFPDLPENAADLPHILDVERREVDRETLADAVRARLESDAADADGDRARSLVDVTYDAEAWAPVDLADVREELTAD
ncbi:hypothetical protein [Halobacterium sp. R2-5]|uniref:DUF7109 family protein n=1 Tax=Halobacterium sp. R2-5 TaxID=2715751 RepID=UPI001420413F|nr:hypothetical protein [Halobacterium sp. R2-5]